ncbi:hypothetical protein BU23DRAFT_184453 [Bimuria novae-zelandiae CBS 107.79]|uniref:Uncharacterized protein n=1 Tax=Bimuria novae-zelandiae CBS 107.79 TaxID=1447943 RepID=A0A6A5V250_9PLEO|nr:hypothetical protein BU23DRAFT_184453 [Bimuria novae-zelandiae CBS 107.79]
MPFLLPLSPSQANDPRPSRGGIYGRLDTNNRLQRAEDFENTAMMLCGCSALSVWNFRARFDCMCFSALGVRIANTAARNARLNIARVVSTNHFKGLPTCSALSDVVEDTMAGGKFLTVEDRGLSLRQIIMQWLRANETLNSIVKRSTIRKMRSMRISRTERRCSRSLRLHVFSLVHGPVQPLCQGFSKPCRWPGFPVFT